MISVRVHPRASRARVERNEGGLEIWVHQPALDGEANRAVLEAVAAEYGVPRSAVRLRTGARGRTKLVEVDITPGS
ncbi:MAG TPA: DUF167 domain-containing protein [Patescibacteria group bacterium]|nr:DUF167 domain-containing protein [Patescibacteria group bacterium]